MKLSPLPMIVLVAAACGPHGAPTPAEAHARLRAAVAAHDGRKLWSALDQDTRWSWMSIQRAWREAYDITLSVLPPGPERERLLARFGPGATSENAETLFARMLRPEDWSAAQALVAAAGSSMPQLAPDGQTSRIATAAGEIIYRKAHDRHWGWGYAGFASQAEELKGNAVADLERMRKDAADYERAVSRGAR